MSDHPLHNPFLQYLGLRLVRWEPGEAEFHLPMAPHLMNRIGQVQGGVLCSLLDVACGYAGLHAPAGEPERHAVTLSLTTSFLDAGHGKRLVARGRVQRAGRSVFFAESEVVLDDRLVLAKAIGSFKFIRNARPAPAPVAA